MCWEMKGRGEEYRGEEAGEEGGTSQGGESVTVDATLIGGEEGEGREGGTRGGGQGGAQLMEHRNRGEEYDGSEEVGGSGGEAEGGAVKRSGEERLSILGGCATGLRGSEVMLLRGDRSDGWK